MLKYFSPKYRGYRDYNVAATEIRSQLLYSCEDRSGASPNK